MDNLNDVYALKEELRRMENELIKQKESDNMIIGEIGQMNKESTIILLNVIWSVTNTIETIDKVYSNHEFLQLLFDYLETSDDSTLITPIIGILINLNSIDTIRNQIGLQTVQIIMKKGILSDPKTNSLILKLILNASLNNNNAINLLNNGILNYLLEITQNFGSSLISLIAKIAWQLNKVCHKEKITDTYKEQFHKFMEMPIVQKENNLFAYNVFCSICQN